MSSGLNTEAALKFKPQVLKNSEASSDSGHKDGLGPEGSIILSYDVQVASNGFFVTVIYTEDIPDERHVVQTMDEVIEILRSTF